MPLETLNTVFAGLTFLVIAVTAVAATVQLRHLRVASFTISDLYRNAKPCIEKMRELRGESLYENFEYLAVQCELWNRRHPNGAYPRGLPRYAEVAK